MTSGSPSCLDSREGFEAAVWQGRQEMELARQAQAALFPRRLPMMGTLSYAGVCLQASQIGGDYYDFLALSEGRLGLLVADVAGKGLAAALRMANLQGILRSQCRGGLPTLEAVLHAANSLFLENSSAASYATLFFAEYHDESRCLRYANCGHLAPILIRCDQSVERLASNCSVLGLFEDWRCGAEEIEMHPGDTLLLHTDGLTEALDERGEEFGEDRLIDLLRRCLGLPVSRLLHTIATTVQAFMSGQGDDITIVAAHCTSPS